MKKIILSTLLLSAIIIGCKKEKSIEPTPEPTPSVTTAPCIGKWKSDSTVTLTKHFNTQLNKSVLVYSKLSYYLYQEFTSTTKFFEKRKLSNDSVMFWGNHPVTYGTSDYSWNNITYPYQVIGNRFIETRTITKTNDTSLVVTDYFRKL